uniref:Small vasohibin-binding protein n=1 Tax=Amphiprion percula TaxID=161767 RepID=A0A3P8TE22_AMPPE
MEPACRKDKPKLNSTPTRGDRAKQKSAQQELKQRQRAEIYALNKTSTVTELPVTRTPNHPSQKLASCPPCSKEMKRIPGP